MAEKAKMRTKITIGLCVKNSEKTVKEAINSIIEQTYPKELMEIIVVDGDSKDKTLSIITSLLSRASMPSKFFSDGGKGLGVARQVVVDNANSKYIVWVDGDVALFNDFVRKQVEFMEQNPNTGVTVGKYIYKQGTLPATLQSMRMHMGSNGFVCTREYRGLPPNDASIYRVNAIIQVGGFDKSIRGAGEDEDIIRRIKAKGWSLSINKEAKFYVRPRDTWRGLWFEQSWLGYGIHYLAHKNNRRLAFWGNFPLASFYWGLGTASRAYKLLHEKKSFLLPPFSAFLKMALWSGFIKSHLDGYGHEIKMS